MTPGKNIIILFPVYNNFKNKNMKAKERAMVLLEQLENHNRALEAGLNRQYPHNELIRLTDRIKNVVEELVDLVEVEDDSFQTRTGFL